jgi:hypothetical protein
MSLAIELLLGVFLFAWLIRGVINFILGLLQIIGGLIGVLLVVIWTAIVAVGSLPGILFPSRKRTCVG